MYRLFITAILVLLSIITLCIGIFQPQMHKNVFIYSSEFEPVENTVKIATEKKEIPSNSSETVVTTKPIQSKQNATTTKKEIVKKNTNKNKSETKASKQTQNNNEIKRTETKQTINNNTINEKKENLERTQVVEKPQTIEESILWNKWRSDLQNQIMKDTKLPIIKEGTVFRFSFNVDKYGRITNIKTWSDDKNYTAYAIQFIAPVIRSYQGKDILNFPQGSNRFETTVEGGWKISDTLKLSTPSDYKDTEKIIKQGR